jgi:endonuclease/exonuclease/phosphatase family metal-dependent hydrolase
MIRALTLFFASALCAQPLRVMSYNVRFPNPGDGPDVWEKRRDLFADSVRETRPDLIGTQELFKLQGDFLVERIPGFGWFGTSRRGNSEDEHMGVFYRKDRLKRLDWGQFWLSETPDVPGSQSWNMSLPRMVTWALFEMGAKKFYLLNTHFAHRREDEDARLKGAAVIVEWLRKLPAGVPRIVTGDFNAPAGAAVHRALLEAGLRDTRDRATKRLGPEGTFHGFRGKPGDARIDWILATPEWKVTRNETVTFSRDGRYPSDHFPVVAEFDLQ